MLTSCRVPLKLRGEIVPASKFVGDKRDPQWVGLLLRASYEDFECFEAMREGKADRKIYIVPTDQIVEALEAASNLRATYSVEGKT